MNLFGWLIVVVVVGILLIGIMAAWIHGQPRECSICDAGKNPPFPEGICPVCGGEGVIK